VSAVLSIPKTLGPAQAGTWFASWNSVAAASELRLVLPAGASLRPTGIVLLAAGIAERQRLGLATRLEHEPGADDARRVLERIGFSAAVGLGTDGGFACREESGRFVALRRITDKRIARELAQASADGLEAELPHLSSSPLRMARFVFEELGVNIVDHSAKPETGFGVLQSFAHGLEIAFADRGIGFLASLQKNPELCPGSREGRVANDAEALQLALGKGVSGTAAPRRNMGMGLGLLQDFADRLGGELWLASGAALLRRRTVAGARTTTVLARAPWPGSWIALEAPLVP
jgi:hypothetical protein